MAIHPALLKGRSVKSDLLSLTPEFDKRSIVVGRTTGEVIYENTKIQLPAEFDIYPLPIVSASILAQEVGQLFKEFMETNFCCHHSGTICAQMEIVAVREKMPKAVPAPNPCNNKECPFFTPTSNESLIEKIAKSEMLPRLISLAVTGRDDSAKFFAENMTYLQLAAAANAIYEQNFTFDRLSEETRKNFRRFLATLGLSQEPNQPNQPSQPNTLNESNNTSQT